MKLIATLMLVALALASAPALAAEPVYVVRHLQKADGDDPSLTAQGAANAQRLAAMLKDKEIAAIFATPTRRAMETAEPLSQKLGISVTPYDPRNADALVDAVAAVSGPVLVVGHSNTVPDLVDRLGGPVQPPMTEDDYGTVFLIDGDGKVTTLEVR